MNKNKKYKAQKIVLQNIRNKCINIRYYLALKQIFKRICSAKFSFTEIGAEINKNNKQLLNSYYSLIDKSVKKRILHKNKANKQKSKISQLINKINKTK